jgi:hypothetical protein
MDIVESTECYEEWLAGHLHLVAADLRAMGWETANVHLGSPGAMPRVQDDLRQRPPGWLAAAAQAMAEATMEDWRAWRRAIDSARA